MGEAQAQHWGPASQRSGDETRHLQPSCDHGNIVKGGMKILKEEVPTENTLAVKSSIGQILVIGPHMKFTTTKQHRAKLFEGFNDRKEFFLHGSVVALRSIELATIESNRLIVLDDDSAYLEVASISIDMEWFVVVRIAKKHIRGQNRLDSVKSLLTFSRPSDIPRLLRSKSSKWSEDVSLFRKHSAVVGDTIPTRNG